MALTQSDAEKIATKLSAEIQTNQPAHNLAIVRYQGIWVTAFGIRRASKEKGHGHIPSKLHISQRQCKDLSNCPMSADDYFAVLRQKNLLPPD